jgi:hypothetical protein
MEELCREGTNGWISLELLFSPGVEHACRGAMKTEFNIVEWGAP